MAIDLTATDILSAGLALAALAVSLAALWQTRRWRPRPVMLIELNASRNWIEGAANYREVRFANRGNADAIDVRCQLITPSGNVLDEQRLGTFEADDEGQVYLGNPTPMQSEYVKAAANFSPDPHDLATAPLRFTWRQAPNIERPRSLVVPAPRTRT